MPCIVLVIMLLKVVYIIILIIFMFDSNCTLFSYINYCQSVGGKTAVSSSPALLTKIPDSCSELPLFLVLLQHMVIDLFM